MARFLFRDSIAMSVALILIMLSVFHSYLLFHLGAEFFSILISFSIFIFGWNTKRHFENNYLLVIAVAYLFIAFFDMLHTLTYQEMGIFDADPNLSIEVWIATRFLESLTFLAAYFLLDKRLNPNTLFYTYLAIAVALFAVIAGGAFPDCYVLGEGLTTFKIASEYVIALILFISGLLLYRDDSMPRRVKGLIITSIGLTIASEFSFTLYHDMFGIFNIVGHMLKIVSFYLLYKAILEVGLTNPMELLTHQLKKSQLENLHKQELLIRQSRLVGAGEALSNAAHQWRQPLSAVGEMIQEIEDSYRYGELSEAYLTKLVTQSMEQLQNLSTTIDRFSTFFSSSERAEHFDARHSIETVLAILGARIDALAITTALDVRCECFIHGVQKEFAQAIFHILNNAIDVLEERDNRDKEIRIRIEENPGRTARIVIEDNAGGIDPAVREKIFEPYSTTKHRGSGVGLGLYIAKSIIEEKMEGQLSLDEGDRGARFTIAL